jgi:hypothetical protein
MRRIALPRNCLADRLGVYVISRCEAGDEVIDVLGTDVRDDVDVQCRARDAEARAGDGAADAVVDVERLERVRNRVEGFAELVHRDCSSM